MIVRVKTIGAIFCLLVFSLPAITVAAEYTVRPFLIDTVVEPRDVETHVVKLVNDAEFTKQTIYATVNEITIDTSGEIKDFVTPVMADQTSTVTSWIEVTRGRIEVPPGEEREVPVTFRINPRAVPGEYHAFIGFVSAPNRPAAQSATMADEADGVIVKITVDDQREDSLHIASFLVDRFVVNDESRQINITVENPGDLRSVPRGEIIFYDSRGEEITSVPVNNENIGVEPGDKMSLQATVPDIVEPGRFKANLALKYGENQRASLYDTTFFYVVPLYMIILTIIAITIVTFIVFYLFKRVFVDEASHDDLNEVTMYVREGHEPNPKDHDIDLKNNT